MKKLIVFIALLLLLVACGGGDGDEGETAVLTVENYMQAKVDTDADTIRALLCSEMEANAERETLTFQGVDNPRIEAMECTFDGEATVSCTGQIVATYGTEDNEFPFTNYRVVQEDGEWKWCGEAY